MPLRHVLTCAAALSAGCATLVSADQDGFVESNLIAILYHELGHALVDVMALPVFGQEEDAADVASIMLIDALFEEDSARAIAIDAAFGFLGEAEASSGETAWWDIHGPDLQRYYTLACLFVGADPEGRADIAETLDLPEGRADTCPEEFDQANASWGAVFEELGQGAPAQTLRYEGGRDSLTEQIVATEIEELNAVFALPVTIDVRVEICDEPNAFYDPGTREIIMCAEFEDWIRDMAPN